MAQNNETKYSAKGRPLKTPDRYTPVKYMHLQIGTNNKNKEEYSLNSAKIIGKIMNFHNEQNKSKTNNKINLLHTYNLRQGLRQFKKKGLEAIKKEMNQIHERDVFEPIHPHELTKEEKRKAMESLIFLTEKKDGRVKARICANGSIQRAYISKDDAASPTASTERVLITSTIEAKQNRDVLTADIPNAFVQTEIDKNNKNKIIMKIRGELVNILTELEPSTYEKYVSQENNSPILYVRMVKVLYGMLTSALLFYKHFKRILRKLDSKLILMTHA